MTRYLVVAHQTATEPHLIKRVRELADGDRNATFTLLVPATRMEHLITWERGESEEIARRRGELARAAFEAAGLTVSDVRVGDELPIWAIEDELRAHSNAYDAIVLSTLPPGRSRWVEMYSHTRAEERFALPIIHVYDGVERAMPDGRAPERPRREPLVRRVLDWLTEPTPGTRERSPRRGYLVLAVLMLVYLAGTATLALTVNQRFFANDALAVVVFGALLISLALSERRRPV